MVVMMTTFAVVAGGTAGDVDDNGNMICILAIHGLIHSKDMLV